jgi:hypothetical protein
MLVVATASYGITCSNVWAITQTLAGPATAGRWTGLQNFMGNFAGILAPAVTGIVVYRTFFLGFCHYRVRLSARLDGVCLRHRPSQARRVEPAENLGHIRVNSPILFRLGDCPLRRR